MHLIIILSVLLSACSIRAVALVETEEAAIQGSTVIQRRQGESKIQNTSTGLLDTLLTPRVRTTEEEETEDEAN